MIIKFNWYDNIPFWHGGGGGGGGGGEGRDNNIDKINAENDRRREEANNKIAADRARESAAQKQRDRDEYKRTQERNEREQKAREEAEKAEAAAKAKAAQEAEAKRKADLARLAAEAEERAKAAQAQAEKEALDKAKAEADARAKAQAEAAAKEASRQKVLQEQKAAQDRALKEQIAQDRARELREREQKQTAQINKEAEQLANKNTGVQEVPEQVNVAPRDKNGNLIPPTPQIEPEYQAPLPSGGYGAWMQPQTPIATPKLPPTTPTTSPQIPMPDTSAQMAQMDKDVQAQIDQTEQQSKTDAIKDIQNHGRDNRQESIDRVKQEQIKQQDKDVQGSFTKAVQQLAKDRGNAQTEQIDQTTDVAPTLDNTKNAPEPTRSTDELANQMIDETTENVMTQAEKDAQAKRDADEKAEADRVQGVRQELIDSGVDADKIGDLDLDETKTKLDEATKKLQMWGVDTSTLTGDQILGSMSLQEGLDKGMGDLWATQGLASGEMSTDLINESGIPIAMENLPFVYSRDKDGNLVISTTQHITDIGKGGGAANVYKNGMSYNMGNHKMSPTSEISGGLVPATVTPGTQPPAKVKPIVVPKGEKPEPTTEKPKPEPTTPTPTTETTDPDLLNTFTRDQRALGIEQGTYGRGLSGRYGSLTGEQLNKLAQALKR